MFINYLEVLRHILDYRNFESLNHQDFRIHWKSYFMGKCFKGVRNIFEETFQEKSWKKYREH